MDSKVGSAEKILKSDYEYCIRIDFEQLYLLQFPLHVNLYYLIFAIFRVYKFQFETSLLYFKA